MPNKFLFADEAGCFTFDRRPNVSRYFILCTICMEETSVAQSLLDLRRHLAWRGEELGEYFHASADKQSVRNAVYETILQHRFSIQATIMEKSKSQPHIRTSKAAFYKHAWYCHFKYGTKSQLSSHHEALITAASLGLKKEKAAFRTAVDDVMRQTLRVRQWKTDFPPAAADPCLQAADYCAWAIQRKWESGHKDTRSYALIEGRLTYEHDLWRKSAHHYY